MQFHETIKYIRTNQNLRQKDLYVDILSQTTYSRFEKGERMLPIEDIEKIANRLGMQLSDIYNIQTEQDKRMVYIIDEINKFMAIKNTTESKLTIADIDSLYHCAEDFKDISLSFLRYYYYIRQHFHDFSPNIPEIKVEDVNSIYKKIKKLKSLTAVYLQFIIDFTVHFSDDQILNISNLFKDYDFKQVSSLNSRFSFQLPEALSNLTDTSIDRALHREEKMKTLLLQNADELLKTLIKYQEIKYSSDHVLLYKISKFRYDYYIADSKKSKALAKEKLEEFLIELEYLIKKSPVPHIYAQACIPSVKNTLSGKLPLKEINYIIN